MTCGRGIISVLKQILLAYLDGLFYFSSGVSLSHVTGSMGSIQAEPYSSSFWCQDLAGSIEPAGKRGEEQVGCRGSACQALLLAPTAALLLVLQQV